MVPLHSRGFLPCCRPVTLCRSPLRVLAGAGARKSPRFPIPRNCGALRFESMPDVVSCEVRLNYLEACPPLQLLLAQLLCDLQHAQFCHLYDGE